MNKKKNKRRNRKIKSKKERNSKQSSCQTTSEVDAVCIQVRSYLVNLSSFFPFIFHQIFLNSFLNYVSNSFLIYVIPVQLLNLSNYNY